jgi:hypothetical protein
MVKAKLDVLSITPIIGAVNNEQKAFVLAAAAPNGDSLFHDAKKVTQTLVEDGMSPDQLVLWRLRHFRGCI